MADSDRIHSDRAIIVFVKALFLEEVEEFALKDLPEPTCSPGEVLIQVKAVGMCGTDFHIYRGAANYNFDANGKPIPLRVQPQILGHEFCGTLVERGSDVPDLKPGDRVVVDQGFNCCSQGIEPVCGYCASGHSHQCLYYKERGITGLAGAMQELVTMPAVNVVPMGGDLSFEEAALVEPLGCVIHSMDMAERARARFTLSPEESPGEPVENVLILGAGPAGLLFLQYIRNVKQFQGQILIADSVDKKLQLAERLGATPIHIQEKDLITTVRDVTNEKKVHFLVEASGNGAAFENMPAVLKKQATVVLYGHGHKGTDLGVLNHLLFLEPTLVASVGASGKLDPQTHRPLIFETSEELIRTEKVHVKSLITHHYRAFEEIDKAFREDSKEQDYIKGVLALS
ncbi:alcohol dehydrogenase catalytic domain-containing protein [Acidobacteria bacterium AH-259-A15]|nr:alcohol dehydrogenase catalytic domain-containing protein [Acidobacteria bacterium AH-259-A15]